MLTINIGSISAPPNITNPIIMKPASTLSTSLKPNTASAIKPPPISAEVIIAARNVEVHRPGFARF